LEEIHGLDGQGYFTMSVLLFILAMMILGFVLGLIFSGLGKK